MAVRIRFGGNEFRIVSIMSAQAKGAATIIYRKNGVTKKWDGVDPMKELGLVQ